MRSPPLEPLCLAVMPVRSTYFVDSDDEEA
jgi:hypothetical protein